MKPNKKSKKAKLVVRKAENKDIPQICKLSAKVYQLNVGYKESTIRGQINNYPEGHFVAVYEDRIVGYCASILLPEERVLAPHTWKEITGGGYGTTHTPHGDYLYGYEVFVDPELRKHRIGQRFYNARKKLVEFYRLKGIVFAGRLPGLSKKRKTWNSVEEYVQKVLNKEVRDTVLSFQIRNGFEVLGVLKDYLPLDKESKGYAAHLIWRNPKAQGLASNNKEPMGRMPGSVRVAVVQYQQRRISSFEEFRQIISYFVDAVSDYKSDFVVFPELFTLQLLSIENEDLPAHRAIKRLAEYTPQITEVFEKLAVKYNINIIGGSHPEQMENGDLLNVATIFLRDGSIHKQAKIHPTPNEAYWWNIKGGDSLNAISTDCGTIGVLVCYDSEFPELSRHLINQGAQIIFVPFLTDEKQSYNRVRYCCQARAVENQCYVAMAGNVGNLPRVDNMEVHYAQSCIMTPCDFPFARNGIAADTTPNTETIAIADLQLELLQEARYSGTVQNLRDRRHDLYRLKWLGQ